MNQLMLQLRTGTDAGREAAPDRPRERRAAGLRGQGGRGAPHRRSTSRPASCALGHEDRLEHVIGHLVQNALDATAERRQRARCACSATGACAVIEVADTGVGMSPEFVRDRLFKPFETTQGGRHGHRRLRKRAVRRPASAGEIDDRQHARRRAPAFASCCRCRRRGDHGGA